MFEWLKDLLRPLRVSDRHFGQMRYLRQTATWECLAEAAPPIGTVEVLIDAGENGPTAAQRSRWIELPRHFERLAQEARIRIEPILAELEIADFECTLAAVVLPADSDAASGTGIELTFGDRAGPPQFDVTVRSWRLQDVIGPL